MSTGKRRGYENTLTAGRVNNKRGRGEPRVKATECLMRQHDKQSATELRKISETNVNREAW